MPYSQCCAEGRCAAAAAARLGHAVLEEESPDTCVCCRSLQRGRAAEAIPVEAEGGKRTEKNKHKQSRGSWGQAGPRARSWRPQFDLGRACPGLPLNAGWETHQAARRTWTGSMRKENTTPGKQGHSSLPPPRSVFLMIPFFFHFSTLIGFQHMAWPGA